jgi:hypothetical protein
VVSGIGSSLNLAWRYRANDDVSIQKAGMTGYLSAHQDLLHQLVEINFDNAMRMRAIFAGRRPD